MANLDSLTLEDLLSMLAENKELLAAPCQLLLVGLEHSFVYAIQQILVEAGWSEAYLQDRYEAHVVFFDWPAQVLREFERIDSTLPIVMAIYPSPGPDEATDTRELELREVVYVKQRLERLLNRQVYTIALLTGQVTEQDRLEVEDVLGIPCEPVDVFKVILRAR